MHVEPGRRESGYKGTELDDPPGSECVCVCVLWLYMRDKAIQQEYFLRAIAFFQMVEIRLKQV